MAPTTIAVIPASAIVTNHTAFVSRSMVAAGGHVDHQSIMAIWP
jgi:hypothetical protein